VHRLRWWYAQALEKLMNLVTLAVEEASQQ
jgi:hypothetical protein